MQELPGYTGAGQTLPKKYLETDNMTIAFIRAATASAALALVSLGSASAAVNLPALNIDKTQTTVSGLSAGGFMAVQLHVA